MEWISVKDRLPEKKESWYWVYDGDEVFEALYTGKCLFFDEEPTLKRCWVFSVKILNWYDKAIPNITHWMPYFTPEPLKLT